MATQRVLITVKTYPTLSRKYGETVCTAGVRADGTWMRIYPVPFRRLDEAEQYRKFDWIEADFIPSKSDPRPETFHPADIGKLIPCDHIGTEDEWRVRRELLLGRAEVFDRLQPLLDGAKANTVSLAVFKPAKITDFIWEPCERDWKQATVEAMRNQARHGELFTGDEWRQTFQLMPKLPYNFSYKFSDAEGRKSELQILDWETGQLYWNCLRAADNDESKALEKVRQKYLEELTRRDLHFFLGTLREFHGFSPNPWVIVGAFAPPHRNQIDLL